MSRVLPPRQGGIPARFLGVAMHHGLKRTRTIEIESVSQSRRVCLPITNMTLHTDVPISAHQLSESSKVGHRVDIGFTRAPFARDWSATGDETLWRAQLDAFCGHVSRVR